jgi:cytochrome c biogenesis protein CcmG, thiol:disulfide interchange protein DsbE
MNRFILPLVAFAALVAVLGIGIRNMPNKGVIVSPLIGRAAPEFSLPDLMNAGRQVGTADVKGKWYLLNVWGTWCVECRHEHDTLLQIKQSGVVPVVGLNWKDEDALALEWLSQLGNPYEHVPVDHEGHTVIDWGVYGAPETFLVNPQGTVVHKRIGAMTAEIWSQEFLPLIQGAQAPGSP